MVTKPGTVSYTYSLQGLGQLQALELPNFRTASRKTVTPIPAEGPTSSPSIIRLLFDCSGAFTLPYVVLLNGMVEG